MKEESVDRGQMAGPHPWLLLAITLMIMGIAVHEVSVTWAAQFPEAQECIRNGTCAIAG